MLFAGVLSAFVAAPPGAPAALNWAGIGTRPSEYANNEAGSTGAVRSAANVTILKLIAPVLPVPSFAVTVAVTMPTVVGVPVIRPLLAVNPFADGVNVT